jgi:two-component system, OmpR family, response regulator RegX3
MALIYLLEDDPDCSACVEQWLGRAGHQVKVFERPHEFFYEVSKQAPRCAVIDWRLPEMEGIDVVARLRQLLSTGTGILMLTGLDTEESVVRALKAGADDYIVKPGSESIVVARIDALLRRMAPAASTLTSIDRPPYRLDFGRREVTVLGHPVDLAPREFDLAWILFSEPARLFTRQELLAAVWGRHQDAGVHTVAQHVYMIRRKLALTEHGFRLNAVYGTGYRLELPQAEPV